jgi:hypothetical protein
MTTIERLLAEFRTQVPEPDEATAERVYGFATAARPRGRRLLTSRAARRPRFVLAVAAVGLAVAGGASALAVHYLGPSPGFSAGFSAFNRLPPAPWPDSMPRMALEHAAANVEVSPNVFSQRLRLLRTGLTLGPGHTQGQGQLYAYISDDGQSGCMFLTGQSGACFKSDYARYIQGLMPDISPGYPGQSPALAALVADNVTSVDLDLSGQLTRLPIMNNSIYMDLSGLKGSDTIALHVTYDDGSTAVDSLVNPLSMPVSPKVPRQ